MIEYLTSSARFGSLEQAAVSVGQQPPQQSAIAAGAYAAASSLNRKSNEWGAFRAVDNFFGAVIAGNQSWDSPFGAFFKMSHQ